MHTDCADAAPPQFPFVCLLVSGGHNLLLLVHGVGDYTLMGTTVDDAMGALLSALVPELSDWAPLLRRADKCAGHLGRCTPMLVQHVMFCCNQCSRAVRLRVRSDKRPARHKSLLSSPVPREQRVVAIPDCTWASHNPANSGQTTGEAYDKIARLLGLDMQPNGGACLEAFARLGDPTRYPFPTPMKRQVPGSMLRWRLCPCRASCVQLEHHAIGGLVVQIGGTSGQTLHDSSTVLRVRSGGMA